MAYDYRCPVCGAYLDPGEKCECEREHVSDSTTKEQSTPADIVKYKFAEQMSLVY